MPTLLTEFLALLVYGPALVLLHELGHALFAGMGGYRVTSFGIGLGPPIARVQLSGPVVVHLDRWFWAGGACIAIPNGPPTTRRIWFHGGGLLLQGALAAVLLVLPDHWLGDRIARFNLLVALTNLLPWRLGANASDGWHIIDALRGNRKAGNPLGQRGLFEQMAQREHLNNSPLGLAYAELGITWTDVVAGRNQDAAEFFAADPPETARHPWTDALYHYVKAEWHRGCYRPLAALTVARQGLAATRDDHTDSIALLAVAEARALIALDEPEAARRVLQRVVASPLAEQGLPIALGAALDADDDDLELATWKLARQIQGPWLDPVEPVLALLDAADALSTRGKNDAARTARRAAAELTRRTLDSAAREDRRTLRHRLQGVEQVPPAMTAR